MMYIIAPVLHMAVSLDCPGGHLGRPGVDLAVDKGWLARLVLLGWPLLNSMGVKVCSSGFIVGLHCWFFPARHFWGWSITVAFLLTYLV